MLKCPYCGTAVIAGAESCTQCESRITWSGDEATFITPDTFVPVFTAREPTTLPVVKSLLEANGIPFTVTNELTQDVLGLGRAGLGFNPIVGPPVIRVPAEHEAAARELISTVGVPHSRENVGPWE